MESENVVNEGESEVISNSTKKSPDKVQEAQEKMQKLVQLPLSRIKQIIKLDPEVHLTSTESIFLITKATEMFIETLAKDAFTHTSHAKKKTVQRKHVDSAIAGAEALIFLEGMLDC